VSAPLVLSLFPGIGLLDAAFEMEGFCVVRGPDLLWGGDIRRFHPPAGKFDGVIGGPPCQVFSRMRFVNPKCGQKHGDLIPEFERVVVEASPDWFVMENVPEAPPANVFGYRRSMVTLKDIWVGGVTSRTRRFTFGGTACAAPSRIQGVALHGEAEHAALAAGGGRPVPVAMIRTKDGGHRKKAGAMRNLGYKAEHAWADHLRKQGLPPDFLSEAPFTVAGKLRAVGNGVPIPMGRAIARAVRQALGLPLREQSA
jgi:DNA (cytosine-5)-methyltransferase 1